VSSLYSFGPFVLEPANRRLSANGRPVELSGRYLDALVLLVVEEGRLVTKARLLDEVWKGVPVTEEALTQCVRSLRKALGDEAGRPRFIETVPRHGYRFIASVTAAETAEANSDAARFEPRPRRDRRQALSHFLGLGRAGLIGGGGAGLVGGLAYGFAGVAQSGAGGGREGHRGAARFVGRIDHEVGHRQLDGVFLEAVDAREAGGGQEFAVHPEVGKAARPRPVGQFGVDTLAVDHQRRQQAHMLAAVMLQQGGGNAVGRLWHHGRAVVHAVLGTQLHIQQPQEMPDLGGGAHRALAAAARQPLLDGHRGWNAIDRIHLGPAAGCTMLRA